MRGITAGQAPVSGGWRFIADRPLPWLLLLAAVLRTIAAFQPGFHHPDAIYQYLEPAQRLLTGDGAVTWEWRIGIRSWLLPALLVPPLALGEALGQAGPWAVALPRLAMGAASLSIVWSAWRLGCRRSAYAGLLAGFVAAIWFEFVFFGVQTLAEPAATAAFLPAAVLLTDTRATRRRAVIAGALLAFAFLMRPHYAPSILTLILVAWWPHVRDVRASLPRWIALAGGGLAVAFVGACVDLAAGTLPFAWIVENFRQNIVNGVAERYGVSPTLAYVVRMLRIWMVWAILIGLGLRTGWRSCPALLAAAVVTVVVHSAIGHKEYRFVYLAVVTVIILSAIGFADLMDHARVRWGDRAGRQAAVMAFVAWGVASVILPVGPLAWSYRQNGVAGSKFFAILHDDPKTCGVAVVNGAEIYDVPGTNALKPGTPIGLFNRLDPALRGSTPWQMMALHQSGFNRIIGLMHEAGARPAGYRAVTCESGLCLYARPGSCTDTRDSPFLLNRVLVRIDL